MGFFLELPNDDYQERTRTSDRRHLWDEVEDWLTLLTEAIPNDGEYLTNGKVLHVDNTRWVGECVTIRLARNMLSPDQQLIHVWHPCPIPPPAGLMEIANWHQT